MAERRTVAHDLGWQRQIVPCRHDRSRMVAERTRDDDVHARLDVRRSDVHTLDQLPNTRRVDVDAVATAARHDLRITRDDENARLLRRRADVAHDAAQGLHWKTLLEDHSEREPARHSARHREIVDRPTDREPTDAAAGEEMRLHDVGVRGKRNTSRTRQDGTVMQRIEDRIAELRQHDLLH